MTWGEVAVFFSPSVDGHQGRTLERNEETPARSLTTHQPHARRHRIRYMSTPDVWSPHCWRFGRDRGGIETVLRGMPFGSSAAAFTTRMTTSAMSATNHRNMNCSTRSIIQSFFRAFGQSDHNSAPTTNQAKPSKISAIAFSKRIDGLAASRADSELVRGFQEGRAKPCGPCSHWVRPRSQRSGRRIRTPRDEPLGGRSWRRSTSEIRR